MQIFFCKFMQEKEEMPTLFKSTFEHNRVELREKIQVTDVLLQELLKRQILIQQNIDNIMVSSLCYCS